MATLTTTEQRRLGLIRPELMRALLQLMDGAEGLGFKTAVPEHGGYRPVEVQRALYEDSLSQGGGELAYPVSPPGRSRHNYGAAFDLHIILGGHGGDGAGSEADYRQLAELAESLELTAGYYFDDSDPYHFQLRETLEQSMARWEAMQRAGIVKIAAIGAALVLAALVVGR